MSQFRYARCCIQATLNSLQPQVYFSFSFLESLQWRIQDFLFGGRQAVGGELTSDAGAFCQKRMRTWKNWILLRGGSVPAAPPGSANGLGYFSIKVSENWSFMFRKRGKGASLNIIPRVYHGVPLTYFLFVELHPTFKVSQCNVRKLKGKQKLNLDRNLFNSWQIVKVQYKFLLKLFVVSKVWFSFVPFYRVSVVILFFGFSNIKLRRQM